MVGRGPDMMGRCMGSTQSYVVLTGRNKLLVGIDSNILYRKKNNLEYLVEFKSEFYRYHIEF